MNCKYLGSHACVWMCRMCFVCLWRVVNLTWGNSSLHWGTVRRGYEAEPIVEKICVSRVHPRPKNGGLKTSSRYENWGYLFWFDLIWFSLPRITTVLSIHPTISYSTSLILKMEETSKVNEMCSHVSEGFAHFLNLYECVYHYHWAAVSRFTSTWFSHQWVADSRPTRTS